jgi:hypothetical protein
MESKYYFKLYYDQKYVLLVAAHTRWEAIDRAYNKFVVDYPKIDRTKFKAIKQ